MLKAVGRDEILGAKVAIVFRTTHLDKAGGTSSDRVAKAEAVELDALGGVILVTSTGLHLHFPLSHLYRSEGDKGYLGGQELVRDFHNAVEPVTLRRLTREEVEQALAR